METKANKFTWVIKDFNSLQSEFIYSDQFVAGGCKWCLMVYPKGNGVKYLSVFLEVADHETLPRGWRINACYYVTVVNQLKENRSRVKASDRWWFDDKTPIRGFLQLLRLKTLRARNGGFLVNRELKIVFEVEVHQVIGLPEEVNQPQAVFESHYLHNETMDVEEAVVGTQDSHNETVDMNDFLVLPSQVELLSRVLKKHPDIAVGFLSDEPFKKKASMNFVLSVIEMMCKSLEEITNDDLVKAETLLKMVKDVGFKVDWLVKKLVEVKEKKKQVKISETRMKGLKDLKQKGVDVEALLEIEKAKVLAIIASPLTLDDVL